MHHRPPNLIYDYQAGNQHNFPDYEIEKLGDRMRIVVPIRDIFTRDPELSVLDGVLTIRISRYGTGSRAIPASPPPNVVQELKFLPVPWVVVTSSRVSDESFEVDLHIAPARVVLMVEAGSHCAALVSVAPASDELAVFHDVPAGKTIIGLEWTSLGKRMLTRTATGLPVTTDGGRIEVRRAGPASFSIRQAPISEGVDEAKLAKLRQYVRGRR